MFKIRPFKLEDESTVIALWQACELTRPWNDPHKDIQRKLQVQPECFVVGTLDDEVVASVMAGYEGHRGWINYLAVSPRHQRKGFGRAMMDHAQQLLRVAGCPKINLQIRSSNAGAIGFYRQIGFTVDDVASMGMRLEDDAPATLSST